MGISKIIQSLILFGLFFGSMLVTAADDNERKPYIVYMGASLENKPMTLMERGHHNLLSETIGDERKARESKIHSYGRSFNGFVAKLLPHEAKKLSEKESVLSVFPNTIQNLHTTRSWDFVGMHEKTKRNLQVESNIIIGVLDTGIWVQSPSFNDTGYGPPPAKWKGKCVQGANFTGCNKGIMVFSNQNGVQESKLDVLISTPIIYVNRNFMLPKMSSKVIGAQYFNIDSGAMEDPTPVDKLGHGTHTASTAAGVPVMGASLYGIGEGTARGGVPSARIASYKICWGIGCSDMDLLAGFDNAIADGVDIISVSVGGQPRHFFRDPMAIGAFHAMKKGILTVCAGGNDGPRLLTVQNLAPWITTVAASSIDRQFVADVKLGNGVKFRGIAINTFSPGKQKYPLTSGALAKANSTRYYGNASACDSGLLSEAKVQGKIVYCLGVNGQDYTLYDIKGAGIIMSRSVDDDAASVFVIPATTVSLKDGKEIHEYINSNKEATAIIHKTRSCKLKNAPFIAYFSSRGPQRISPNILKPDIAAPGVSILAAHSIFKSASGSAYDKRFVKYNIESGTSMACPHVAGAAAFVKSFHPTWSPAVIKSALMTTATPMKVKTVDMELASGSGQINPRRAIKPGLIYDINTSAYIRYLCKEGYNSTTIGILMGGKKKYNCSSFKPAKGVDGLNYPSFHVQIQKNATAISAVFERIVTNVGCKNATYKANVTSPDGLSIKVFPSTLCFENLYEKRSFKVVLEGKFDQAKAFMLSGSLVWSDSKHFVRSPIVVYRSSFTAW